MNTKLLAAMAIAMTFAGCASTPTTNPALESARAAVRSAEADPNVGMYAALDLQAAKGELQEAESAAMKHDEEDIAQPAYLAAQTARLAQLKGSAKADDARVAAGQTERDRIQLNARTSEVEGAKLARDQANQKASDANQKAICFASGGGCTEREAHRPRLGSHAGRRIVRYGQGRSESGRVTQSRSTGAVPDGTR